MFKSKEYIRLIKIHPSWKKEGKYRNKSKNHLVYVSSHNSACEKCSKLQGKVYIDDVFCKGSIKDGNYPLLSNAIKAGLFHDGCRHGISTYFDEINSKP